MDRWLCAALFGYALTFIVSTPKQLLLWALLFNAAVFLAAKLRLLYLNRLLIGCILCGIAWGSINVYFYQEAKLPSDYYGVTLPVKISIQSITQVYPNFWRIEGDLLAVGEELLTYVPRARLSWFAPPDDLKPPQVGTVWLLQARLKAPQGVRNDGGFLYHRYLVGQGIHVLGSIRDGQLLGGQPSYRQQLYNQLSELLRHSEHAGILQALTVGERQQISPEQWQLYQRTGLAHLIAISGLHLSLVAIGVIWAAQWLLRFCARHRGRREQLNSWYWAMLIALVATLYYAALAGFATSTIRAFAMFSVVLWHKYYRIHTPPSRVLLRAVALVVIVQPFAPLQTGFWLSVGAVATILLMNWRWLPIQGRWASLRSLWRLEVVLTLALWPLTALWFGGLPILAPLTNLLVIPVVTFWVLPLALIAMLLLMLSLPSAAKLLFDGAALPLAMFEPSLQIIADAKWQWLPTHLTGSWSVLSILLLSWVWPWHWRYKLCCGLVLILTQLISWELQWRDTEVRLHVLDVDQGSAIVIEQGHEAMLIDTGANWEFGSSMAERAIIPFLTHHRLTPVVGVVSHTDNDHLGGYLQLVEAYPFMRWYGSGTGLPCVAGQSGQWRRVKWLVLHPRRVTNNRHNDDSCVVRVTIGQHSVLIPGDITYRAERQLLAFVAPVASDILVLAHHGSNSSSERLFLAAVNPQLAIVSRGRNNAYGMVATPVKERLNELQIPLLDTALGGQITLRFNSSEWSVEQPWAGADRPWFDSDN